MWRMRGAEVAGIYVEDPTLIYVKKWRDIDSPLGVSSDIASGEASLDEVFESFPGLPVYTMGTAGLVELPRP